MSVGGGVLACSVRGCGLALELDARTARCANGHSFDRARSGYWNLLQPQDRRSRAAGDEREAVEARARGFARGVGAALIERLAGLVAALRLAPESCMLELGSGSGDALACLQRASGARAVGLDLSTAAAEHSAKRFSHVCWVVANADRRLPILDGSIALVLSIHGRRNPAECARVLTPGGHALFAVPAADDLQELREALHGASVSTDRRTGLLRELSGHFELVDQGSARSAHVLERPALQDLLRSTYRGQRNAQSARLGELDALQVTLASDWVLCTVR